MTPHTQLPPSPIKVMGGRGRREKEKKRRDKWLSSLSFPLPFSPSLLPPISTTPSSHSPTSPHSPSSLTTPPLLPSPVPIFQIGSARVKVRSEAVWPRLRAVRFLPVTQKFSSSASFVCVCVPEFCVTPSYCVEDGRSFLCKYFGQTFLSLVWKQVIFTKWKKVNGNISLLSEYVTYRWIRSRSIRIPLNGIWICYQMIL